MFLLNHLQIQNDDHKITLSKCVFFPKLPLKRQQNHFWRSQIGGYRTSSRASMAKTPCSRNVLNSTQPLSGTSAEKNETCTNKKLFIQNRIMLHGNIIHFHEINISFPQNHFSLERITQTTSFATRNFSSFHQGKITSLNGRCCESTLPISYQRT